MYIEERGRQAGPERKMGDEAEAATRPKGHGEGGRRKARRSRRPETEDRVRLKALGQTEPENK